MRPGQRGDLVRFDANLPSSALQQIPELAQAAERLGFDGLWTAETQHDPFLPLALAAEHTRRIQIGAGGGRLRVD